MWEPFWLPGEILESFDIVFMMEEAVGEGEQLFEELMGQLKLFCKQ